MPANAHRPYWYACMHGNEFLLSILVLDFSYDIVQYGLGLIQIGMAILQQASIASLQTTLLHKNTYLHMFNAIYSETITDLNNEIIQLIVFKCTCTTLRYMQGLKRCQHEHRKIGLTNYCKLSVPIHVITDKPQQCKNEVKNH